MSDYINKIREHVEWGRGPNDLLDEEWGEMLGLYLVSLPPDDRVDVMSNIDIGYSSAIPLFVGLHLNSQLKAGGETVCMALVSAFMAECRERIKADFNRIAEQYRQEVADDMAAGIN
jgi:hypothetical protein